MPESSSSFGDSIAPPQTMTSRAVRVRPVVPAALAVLDAGAATVLEEQLGGLRVGLEGQVRAVERRLEVGPVGREPLAVDHVDVVPAGAFHVRAVEIVGRAGSPARGMRR